MDPAGDLVGTDKRVWLVAGDCNAPNVLRLPFRLGLKSNRLGYRFRYVRTLQ